ncbi:unnamed protein product [Gongylonema pulchrum]|uniref:WASH-7_N domain-containing protein n=1 Tax=Gongylonema pulchrum TaxID=637853 RepID=A0A183DJ69_9BILA|nr:unnamed protein product [Gongylonema pulchrum]
MVFAARKSQNLSLENTHTHRVSMYVNTAYYNSGPAVVQLSRSGNAVVDKCIITFATLELEVEILMDEARSIFYNALITYGEDGAFSREVLLVSKFLSGCITQNITFLEGKKLAVTQQVM